MLITSHSFREILGRVNKLLRESCKEKSGFVWTKNVVPQSFRHIHISVLRDDPSIPLKEVQERVGHLQEDTTNAYTHLLSHNQEKSVVAISKFVERLGVKKQDKAS